MLFDECAYEVLDANLHSVDALHFVDLKAYADRIREYEKKTGLSEAIITARGMMGGVPVYILAMEFGFLGGSVASVVGEKIARACERALEDGRPVIIVSCSGGMRMQEGMLSLMQMAKSSAAIARLAASGAMRAAKLRESAATRQAAISSVRTALAGYEVRERRID